MKVGSHRNGARRARHGARLLASACAPAWLAALALGAAPAAGGPLPPGPSSAIHDRIYTPAAITVAAGQTISWQRNARPAHGHIDNRTLQLRAPGRRHELLAEVRQPRHVRLLLHRPPDDEGRRDRARDPGGKGDRARPR